MNADLIFIALLAGSVAGALGLLTFELVRKFATKAHPESLKLLEQMAVSHIGITVEEARKIQNFVLSSSYFESPPNPVSGFIEWSTQPAVPSSIEKLMSGSKNQFEISRIGKPHQLVTSRSALLESSKPLLSRARGTQEVNAANIKTTR